MTTAETDDGDTELRDRVDGLVSKAQRLNHAALRRLVGILDLEPPLRADAVEAAVTEELTDQRARALQALGSKVPAARAALEACSGAAFPHAALERLRRQAVPEEASILGDVLDRYHRFERRLGWLLRPSTLEEVEKLDPHADRNQIYHFVSYDFRLEQKLFAVLFELAPVMVPYSALMFASTGEFELRAFKRINDTVMFFSNMIEWGLDSKRGRDAVARLNTIHGRYTLPSELFRFILSGIMFIPVHFNERLGWRRFTDVERLGWFYTFAEMGRAMNIAGVTDDFDEMHAWWRDMVARAGETSPVGQKVFHQIVVQVLATYPAPLRRPLLAAIICGMPDPYRHALDIPPPPEDLVAEVRQALRFVGLLSRDLPRVPWIRSLQLHPLYRQIGDIGVGQRSAYMPRPPAAPSLAENAGYPREQKPVVSAGALSPAALPEMTMDEVARHSSAGDAWIAIDGYVYDVTRFLYDHPGGHAVLARHFGRDASEAFAKVGHSRGALVMMANFRIGRVTGAIVTEFSDPAEPGGHIHTGRRLGLRRQYEPGDWDRLLDSFVDQTARYERAKAVPGRDPHKFPVDLPVDPRVKARATEPEASGLERGAGGEDDERLARR
jgi:predicted heme/steroid binding protein